MSDLIGLYNGFPLTHYCKHCHPGRSSAPFLFSSSSLDNGTTYPMLEKQTVPWRYRLKKVFFEGKKGSRAASNGRRLSNTMAGIKLNKEEHYKHTSLFIQFAK